MKNEQSQRSGGIFPNDPQSMRIIALLFFCGVFYLAYIRPELEKGKSWKELIQSPGLELGWIGVVFGAVLSVLVFVSVVLALILALKMWHFFRPVRMRTIRVRLQDEMDVKPKQVLELAGSLGTLWERKWYKRFLFGPKWYILRITRDRSGKFAISYRVPVHQAHAVLKRLRNAFPDAIVDFGQEEWQMPDVEGQGGHLKMARSGKGYGLSGELTGRMGDILAMMPKDSILQVTFSPTSHKEIAEEGKEEVEDIMEKDRKIREDHLKITGLSERYIGRSAFTVSIFLWSAEHSMKDTADEIQSQTKGDYNQLVYHRYRVGMKWRNPLRWWFPTPPPTRRVTMNDRELAHFLQLPDPHHPHIWEDLEITVKKKLPASHELRNGIRIGLVDDPSGKNRDARLRVKTLTNHGIIAGMAGGGKGAVLNFFMEDFLRGWARNPDSWPGLTYGDPHRRGILNIINLAIEIEKELKEEGLEFPWERFMVLSVGPGDYPAPLNILHCPPGDDIDDVAAEAVEAILNAFPGDLSKSRVMLENAIHALLWDDEPHTIRDIEKIFKQREGRLRRKLMRRIQNPIVRDWLVHDLEPRFEKGDVPIDAITTRINPFLAKRSMQRIFGQTENVLDVRKILEEGWIVLIDFLGAPDEAFKLTAGWLTNRYYREAQKRVGGGRPHILIYDECQKFHVPKFTAIYKENRKFDLGLVLMTQEIEKVDKDLLSAAATNSGFVVSVQQSVGAKQMANMMHDSFSQNHLQSLRRVLNQRGEVERLEAALWSVDGVSNLVVPPPAFILDGEPTKMHSPEEKRAIQEAEEKMQELIKRHARHKDEVDRMLAGEEEPEETRDITPEEVPKGITVEELEQAMEIVVQEQKATQALLQQKMKIGRSKAARLLDALERRGVVGPKRGTRGREVRVKRTAG